MPQNPGQIIIIGAGGIVRDGHLPAYRKAGWPVVGIFDLFLEKAEKLAAEFAVPKVFTSIKEAVSQAPAIVIYDIAVPASTLIGVLEMIPSGATVLMQKPMGETIEEASAILTLCREKKFIAAVNFQMRFIPAVVVAKQIIDSGAIGQLHDVEIKMNIFHPWHLWEFLFSIPRMEMLYHSIHYMDMMRHFFGDPKKIYAKTLKHPLQMQLASTRSMIIMEYDEIIKSHIDTNHGHDFGLKHQESYIKFEGTKGAIKTTLGMNIDYPKGVKDTFEYVIREDHKTPIWQTVDLKETWFPDAFIGSMANLMCYREGLQDLLINSVESAFKTMSVVEAAYESSNIGGTQIKYKY